jgi:molybdate transport system substrate-binding protein
MKPLLIAGIAALAATSFAAQAAEIRVAAGGAAHEALGELAAAFKKKTGHEVKGSFAPMGTLANRLKAGEKADLLFMTGSALAEVEKGGIKLDADRRPLGRVLIGLAVKEGAKLPDISTVEAFKKALLAAKSVAYVDPATGATSGTHFAKMLEKMGIADQMKPKTLLRPGGYVVELVAKGEAEMGVHQITEILPVKGAKLVGPLPADVNLVSTYTGVLVAGAPPAAKAFFDFATGPEAKAAVEHAGFQWPR